MGLILDSSVVIAAERRGDTVERLIERVVSMAGDQDAALSAVGLTELVHGRSTSALCLLEDARSVAGMQRDRKSTRLNSSHSQISYAVFCLKKKNYQQTKISRLANAAQGTVRPTTSVTGLAGSLRPSSRCPTLHERVLTGLHHRPLCESSAA